MRRWFHARRFGAELFCGEGGIRTRGTLAGTHDFQSCTFGHSVTSPGEACRLLFQTRDGPPLSSHVRREEHQAIDAFARHRSLVNPGGESGIRTHGTLAGTPDFESG